MIDIEVTQENRRVPVTVLQVKGSVDAASYEQLQQRAREVIDGGSRHLVVDLSQVPYMSSAGLRALNVIYNLLHAGTTEGENAAANQGVRSGKFKSPYLKLVGPTQRVAQVLHTSGYDMFLDIHKKRQDAIESF